MEDMPVKILELGEGEILIVVHAAGQTTQLREGHLARSHLSSHILLEPRAAVRPRSADPPTFRREGQHWRVSYEGAVASLQDTVGVRHLARLLAEPARQFRCDDLLAMEAGGPPAPAARPGDLAADPRAVREYRRRLEHLAEEVAAARAAGEGERGLLLQHEHDRLEAHLRAVTGRRGRGRRVADGLERARQTVSAAIRRTMKVLQSAHRGLWHHLYNHLKTGYFCQYWPTPPVTWVTA